MSQDASASSDMTWPLIAEEVDAAVAELAPPGATYWFCVTLPANRIRKSPPIWRSLPMRRPRRQRALESLRPLLTLAGVASPWRASLLRLELTWPRRPRRRLPPASPKPRFVRLLPSRLF